MKKIRILAILLAVTLLALSLTACASGKSAQYADSADSVMTTETASAPAAEAPMEESVEAQEAKADGSAFSTTANDVTEDAAPEADAADAASKIIYSANLQAQTTDFDAAIAALDKQIAAFGGFIVQQRRHDLRRQPLGRLHHPRARGEVRRIPAADRGARKRHLRQPVRRKRDEPVHGL